MPADEDAFDLLFVPRLVRDLTFEVHLQANLAQGFGLKNPLFVIGDRLLFRIERILEHLPRLLGMRYRARLGRGLAPQVRDLVGQKLGVGLFVRDLGLEQPRSSRRYGPVSLAE